MDDKKLEGFIKLGNSQYKVDYDSKNYCEKDFNLSLFVLF